MPWGAAVALDEVDGRLANLLSQAIIDWHASGWLIELEAKWGIPATAWLASMQKACEAGEKICNDQYDDE